MGFPVNAKLGLAMRFDVVIDGYDLGSWSTCKGLSVSFKYEKVKELGEHTMNAFIPGWVEYPPVSLQRAMVKSDWSKTKDWLQIVASAPWLLTDSPIGDIAGGVSASVDGGEASVHAEIGGGAAGLAIAGPSSGKITLRDAGLEEVASWELDNVLPSAWKAPQFDANGKAVAIETLELVHEGFLVCLNV